MSGAGPKSSSIAKTGLTVAELPLGLLVVMPLRLASDQDLALRLVRSEEEMLVETCQALGQSHEAMCKRKMGLTVAELPLGLLVLMPLRLASDQDLTLRLVRSEGGGAC